MKTAWIINFGNELLIGRIVNTNGSWLARELTIRGYNVRRIIVAPDEEPDAVEVLREAAENADIIICTGGLGPTHDDRTAEFLAKATGRRLVLNEDAKRMVEEKYAAKGLPLTDERLKMAMMPEGSRPIPNPVGTAPGIHLVTGSTQFFCLPGVPREMEAMFNEYVSRVLESIQKPPCILEASVVIRGVPESTLAPVLKKAVRECSRCYVKSHPKGHELEQPVLDVRVLYSAPDCNETRRVLERVSSLIATEAEQLGGVILERSIQRPGEKSV